jgi:hypothetical protein
MAYELEGKLLEVCTCNVLCPCWVGEDPDGGVCEGLIGYQIDRGTINGVDVSGHNFTLLAHIPGNILQGNWRVIAYVDDKTTPQQQQALLDVWTGKLGGPVADLAQLVGEVVAFERVPMDVQVQGGKGTIVIGQAVEASMSPLRGATGEATTLHDTIFTTIPGSPAYPGKAEYYRANAPALGIKVDLHDHNAVQGTFRFVAE